MGVLVFVAIILALSVVFHQYRKNYKKELEELPDDIEANDSIVYIRHKGFELCMRAEEQVAWDAMSPDEKTKQVKKTRTALKKGDVVAVARPGGEEGYCFVPRELALKHFLRRKEVKGVKYETSWPYGTDKR